MCVRNRIPLSLSRPEPGIGNRRPSRPVVGSPAVAAAKNAEEDATNKHNVLTDDVAEEQGDDRLTGLQVIEDQDEQDELADEAVEEAEEVRDAEDVEEALDVILANRFGDGHPDDEFETVDDDDIASEGAVDVVALRRPDEFLCRACFLLKKTSQLADRAAQLCRDCA